MKTRNGFVSNSSTSSFIVMGTIFESVDEFRKALTPYGLEQIEKEIKENEYENMEEWIRDNSCSYYGDDSFAFGAHLGSVDYAEAICSFEAIKNAYENETKLFEEFFGKDKFEVELIGIRAEC